MGGMGLGMVAEQLTDLKLSELLDTPPPGLDEAVAVAKVSCSRTWVWCRICIHSAAEPNCCRHHPWAVDAAVATARARGLLRHAQSECCMAWQCC